MPVSHHCSSGGSFFAGDEKQLSLLGFNMQSGSVLPIHEVGTANHGEYEALARLPCLPQVIAAVMHKAVQSSVDVDELASLVALDPTLATRVMMSAWHESPQRLTGLPELIHLLGIEKLHELCRQATFQCLFSDHHFVNDAALLSFWRHSLLCAITAGELAARIKYRYPEEAYLAGLVHDIGEVALGSIGVESVDAAQQLRLEKERYGTTHTEKGADVLSIWRGRSYIPDAVRYHHLDTGKVAEAHELVRIVYVANLLSHRQANHDEVIRQAHKLLGISEEQIREVIQHARQTLEQLQKQTRIALSEEHMAKARKQLARSTHKQALLYAHLSSLYGLSSAQEVFGGILQGAQRLFMPVSAVLFNIQDNQFLRGVDAVQCNRDMVTELSVSLYSETSLLIQSLKNKQVIAAASDDAAVNQSILDSQLMGLLGSRYFVCLPLLNRNQPAGLLVMGFESALKDEEHDLLMMFGYETGRIIHATQKGGPDDTFEQDVITGETAAVATEFHTEARKLVHEVSNPLAVIMNYLAVLAAKLGESHTAREDVRIIREEIERVNTVIRRFADDAPKQSNKSVDINAVIHDMVRALKEGLLGGLQISIKLDLDKELGSVRTDRDRLKQVVINLLKNAIEAVMPSGSIKVKTRGRIRMDNGDYIEITIMDNGPGIPEHIYKNLFKPVQTSKGADHSGLGLNIVSKLVSEMGGKISCRTTTGKGTVFQLLLPMQS